MLHFFMSRGQRLLNFERSITILVVQCRDKPFLMLFAMKGLSFKQNYNGYINFLNKGSTYQCSLNATCLPNIFYEISSCEVHARTGLS